MLHILQRWLRVTKAQHQQQRAVFTEVHAEQRIRRAVTCIHVHSACTGCYSMQIVLYRGTLQPVQNTRRLIDGCVVMRA